MLLQRFAETAMVTMQVYAGLLLLPFLKPPSPAWVGGEPFNRDQRYLIFAGLVLAAYLPIFTVPTLRHFFELYLLKLIHHLGIGLVAVFWALAVCFAWRNALLDRFWGTRISPF